MRLSIDTACGYASVALLKDGEIKAFERDEERNMQAENLPAIVSRILESFNISLHDVEGIIVTNGPGSFTGIRIGLSYAYGLKSAGDKPMFAVSTLESMAKKSNTFFPYSGADKEIAMLALYAGRGQYYCQKFAFFKDTKIQGLGKCELLSPLDLAKQLILSPDMRLHGFGVKDDSIIKKATEEAWVNIEASKREDYIKYFAVDMEADAAYSALAANLSVAQDLITPCYIREPDAKKPSAS